MFSVHADAQAGGRALRTSLASLLLTYVFVEELALVPVVQVNELSRTLLLSIHPGPHILAAGLHVDVGALPVPGADREHKAFCSEAPKTFQVSKTGISIEGGLGRRRITSHLPSVPVPSKQASCSLCPTMGQVSPAGQQGLSCRSAGSQAKRQHSWELRLSSQKVLSLCPHTPGL